MGLFFKAEHILGLVYDPICEDKGIMELRYLLDIDPENIWLNLLWIPVGCAAGCIDHLLVHLWKNFDGFRFRRNHIINPLIFSAWLIFTFLSLISLLQFGRAKISYIMKFIHVAFELTNVMIFLYTWGLTGSALVVGVLSLLGIFSSLSMSCVVMYDLTAIGAILDSFNFFICILQFEKSKLFLIQTFSFFFHATYIWSFLAMAYLAQTELQVLLFRIYGVVANSAAIYVGTIAMDLLVDEIDPKPSVVKKENDSNVQKDTALFSSTEQNYVFPCRGVEVNLSSFKNKMLFRLSLFCPGVFRVLTNKNEEKVLSTLFINFKKIVPVQWDRDIYVIQSSDMRISKMLWWSLFFMFLHYFLVNSYTFSFVFLILWFIPSLIAATIIHMIFRH